jgi:DNA-binding CsgD family transcriptional regulator
MGVNMAISVLHARLRDGAAPHRSLASPSRPQFADVRPELSSGDTADLLDQALNLLSDGIVLTDGLSRIHYANRAARIFMARGMLSTRGGWLQAATSQQTQALQGLIAGCVEDDGGGSVHMRVGVRLCLTITRIKAAEHHAPEQGCAMILLRDLGVRHGPTPQSTMAYFGLTPAEAKVAREIVQGDGLARCARRLGIRVTTARSHLKHVFEKTETRRQADLVRLLLSCGSGHLAAGAPPGVEPSDALG